MLFLELSDNRIGLVFLCLLFNYLKYNIFLDVVGFD